MAAPILRPYQTEAVEQGVSRGNLLLALVMGAGKTAVAIRTVRQLRRERKATHGIVLAGKSLKYQWAREIRQWDPRASVQVVEGDRISRWRAIRRSGRFNYTILHYECLIHDWEQIRKHLPLDFIIADEVTAIKGMTAKRSKRLKILAKDAKYRFGLSGQPVENRPEELYSIMQFIDPAVLGPFQKFDRTFVVRDYWGRPQRYRNLPTLHRVMNGAIYRKSRDDIKEWLPEMVEME